MTFDDIQSRLGITTMQLEMLIYSGAIPPATIGGNWCKHHIEPFLQYQEARAIRAKKSHETGEK